ncbi:MAG: hypothetical protein QXK52_07280 [Candidatus Bathyarchaeia archaeon]
MEQKSSTKLSITGLIDNSPSLISAAISSLGSRPRTSLKTLGTTIRPLGPILLTIIPTVK